MDRTCSRSLKAPALAACIVIGASLAWAKPPQRKAAAGAKHAHAGARVKATESSKPQDPEEKTAYEFELPGPEGQHVKLADFRGKTLLIVNLASKSGYNSQLPELEKLSGQYQAKGLVVIGVPSNDFGAAEPDADAMLQKIYKVDAKVTFPVMAKSVLIGVQELPFYTWLTTSKGAPVGGPVHWNYTKFLVDKNGKVVARFDQDVTPQSPQLLSTLSAVLDGTYKPHPATTTEEHDAGSDEEESPR